MSNRIVLALTVVLLNLNTQAQIYGEEIVHWDFSEGITDDWESGSASGISHWEYRGPDTTPDNTVCSLGSCGEASEPIESLSAADGFVIFDSNYWDDDLGPCGPGLGSGIDPAPHDAWLITPSVDLSNNTTVVLTFQQQYKHFQTETSVLMSIDGGDNYELIHMNPTSQSAVSEVVEWVSVNISDLAAGESDVRFKFSFTQTYYWWLLDDIVLYEPNENDLLLTNPKYTNFDFSQEPDGLGDIEYNGYPISFLPELNFSVLATNIGGQAQTGVQLEIEIEKNNSEIVYTQTTDSTTIEAGTTISLGINEYVPNNGVGHYDINYELIQDQDDQGPLNNFAYLDFNITEYEYIRDEGPMVDQYVPNQLFIEEHYQIGNIFESDHIGKQWHSMGVAFGDSTTIGTTVYGVVSNLARDTIYATTDEYIINAWDLNNIGEEKIIHLPFQESFTSETDRLYLVMIGHYGGSEERMRIARSGFPPAQTSILSYPDANNLFYLLKTPIVRQYIFETEDNPGCMDSEAMNFDSSAGISDDSCRYPGCTNEIADNFDSTSNWEDGSCIIQGCTDMEADNFNADATSDNGTCEYWGCTDQNATNFDSSANVNDGSCIYEEAFMIVSDTTGCTPFTITVFNQTSTLSEGICEFTLGDGGIHDGCEESFEYTYTEAGDYTISYTYTISENESTYEIGSIMVFDPPEVPVIEYNSDDNILSCSSCDGAVSYQWYMDLEPVGPNADSFQPAVNNYYTLVITDEHGCSMESEEVLVIVVGVDEIDHKEDILVYPNPASNILWVESKISDSIFKLYNSQGQLVVETNLLKSNIESVDISNMSNGMYFYIIESENDNFSGKLIIGK